MHFSRRHEMVAIVALTHGDEPMLLIWAHLGVGHKTIFYARRQSNPDPLVIIIFDYFYSSLNLQCSSAV